MSKRHPTVKKLDKRVKKIENEIELKYVDFVNTAFSATAAPAGGLLNAIERGTPPNNRIGNEVRATSVQIRYNIFNAIPAEFPQIIRVIVFYDRQANGGNPGFIGASSTNALLDNDVITNPVHAPYNQNTRMRYHVMYDKVHVLIPQSDTQTGLGMVPHEMFIRKHIKLGRKTRYDANNIPAAIADISTNSLWVMVVADATYADPPTMNFSSRFFFKDA